MTRAFVEADKLNREKENAAQWRQGMYFYDALLSIVSGMTADPKRGQTPHKYPERPYGFPAEEQEAPVFDEEEMQKKRAQVRGLQARLLSSRYG